MPGGDHTAERVLEAGDLRVRFYWHADRFAHEVAVRIGDEWHPVATSLEGSPTEDWPQSPPFQSLHIEHRSDGRRLALLVGMAGKSHWSASIEIDTRDERRPSVLFDVACRVRTCEVGRLGSAYRLFGPGGSAPLRIVLGEQFGPARLEESGERAAVVAEAARQVDAQTVRWDYRLELA